jgi:hypothetical protein
MKTYTLVYTGTPRNLSKTDFKTAWDAIPPDPMPVDELGLALMSDNSAIIGANVVRTIQYQGSSADSLEAFLENLNTFIFNKALCTLIDADPVVVT